MSVDDLLKIVNSGSSAAWVFALWFGFRALKVFNDTLDRFTRVAEDIEAIREILEIEQHASQNRPP